MINYNFLVVRRETKRGLMWEGEYGVVRVKGIQEHAKIY